MRSENSVLLVYMTQKRAPYAYHTNLWMPATISWQLFAHFRTRKYAAPWVSETHTWTFPQMQLLPFSRACFRVVLAGGILVLRPATEHCGQRRNRYTHFLIQARMHANSDTETSHACGSYRRMNVVLLQWTLSLNNRGKLKGQCSDVNKRDSCENGLVNYWVIANKSKLAHICRSEQLKKSKNTSSNNV